MKLAPALVPLEAWFWDMLFLDPLSAKPCLGFLIELKLQMCHGNTSGLTLNYKSTMI